MTISPSASFVRGLTAYVDLWQRRVINLTEDQIRKLNPEYPKLQRVVTFGLTLPEVQAATARLALHAFPLIERCGHWRDWLPLLERALASFVAQDLTLQFELLNRLGQLLRLDWQLEAAIDIHKQAEKVAEQIDKKTNLIDVYYNLCVDYRICRAYDEAEKYGLAALSELRQLSIPKARTTAVLNALGLIAREKGDLEKAEARLREAVELGRLSDPPTHLARIFNSLAMTLQNQKKYQDALAFYNEAHMLLSPTASELDKIRVHINLGALYFELLQWDKAEATFRHVDSLLHQQRGQVYYYAVVAQSLGNTLLKQRRVDEALTYLHRSNSLWLQLGDDLMQANTLGTLGEALANKGRVEEARSFYDEAIVLLKNHLDNSQAQRLFSEFTAEKDAL